LNAASLLTEVLTPVKADLDQMNQNLKNVVGARHPMLMAAADQIFGAGGKKLRPVIVFLVARATMELMGQS
jgi:all-trans-nonaprenyl-diphosphate synthase